MDSWRPQKPSSVYLQLLLTNIALFVVIGVKYHSFDEKHLKTFLKEHWFSWMLFSDLLFYGALVNLKFEQNFLSWKVFFILSWKFKKKVLNSNSFYAWFSSRHCNDLCRSSGLSGLSVVPIRKHSRCMLVSVKNLSNWFLTFLVPKGKKWVKVNLFLRGDKNSLVVKFLL